MPEQCFTSRAALGWMRLGSPRPAPPQLPHKHCCRVLCFQTQIRWLGPGESKEERGEMKNSSLKVELHSDRAPFSVDRLRGLCCAYQQLAARGAEGCSGNSALFTKRGTACLTTSRRCFNFLPFGGQFEEHLSISPLLLLASRTHERWELIVLTHWLCHQKSEAALPFSHLCHNRGNDFPGRKRIGGAADPSPRLLLVNGLLLLVNHIGLT